ncbi:MAG: 16S rRNA (adenine(1518)-N(6)/adenine(1519)-N(6))-dimethyltransferase RsmA [Candidatus Eremiobacteraeota bacterium]|nr:16S rRNA (adenine(1518)-N(6)/adenine(1519)-N(6))-dimethyltransferase RsmA [Candidatus Eremiobacteraeota bacterium]
METDDPHEHPRALLQAWGLRPKKKLGQNFLTDGKAAQRIARLSLVDAPAHARVLEIGAGTGVLTKALIREGADVTAIEIDSQLVAILRSQTGLELASIVPADALAFDYGAYAAGSPWRVAGNLPYNVATPIIVGFCEMVWAPETVTVMIQKDVADRLAAQPGTPQYGSLSIAVQYAMTVERAFTLRPQAFYPAPKVDSTVVQLVRRAEAPVHPRDVAHFRTVVRAAFAYRRKTLANSLVLAMNCGRDDAARAIRESHLDEMVRGEQLSMADFARLSDALSIR